MAERYLGVYRGTDVVSPVLKDTQGNLEPGLNLGTSSGAALPGFVAMFAGATTPTGWLLCDGSVLNIADFPVLGALLGATYGGDGVTTFGVPDARGRLMLGAGAGPGLTARARGDTGGDEAHTDVATHTHTLMGENTGATANNVVLTVLANHEGYSAGPTDQALGASSIASTGIASVAHMNPFSVVNFIIKT